MIQSCRYNLFNTEIEFGINGCCIISNKPISGKVNGKESTVNRALGGSTYPG